MNKIISIIIPTYNMENYLYRCLDSLLIKDEALFDKIEVLVINDGSKDSSSEIAHEYQKNYADVFKVIDKENGNYGSCVNKGIELATGKYLRILDADDWFDTVELKRYIKKLQDVNSDVVITNYTRHYGKNRKKYISLKNIEYDKELLIDCYDFSRRTYKELLLMHALTFKTDLLRSIGFKQQTGISYTDIEYCYFPFSRAKTMVFFDVNLYQYCIGREGQTMQRNSIVRNIDHFYMVAKRLLIDYLENVESNRQRYIPLVYIISNPIYFIYLSNLYYQKKPSIHDKEVLDDITMIIHQDAFFENYVNNYTFKKIPFVKLWKHYGFRIGVITGK